MPAYEVIDSAPACPLSSVVEEQSWEAPLRYESATNNAFMVSQSNFIRTAGRSDGGNGACHESLPRSGLVQMRLCTAAHNRMFERWRQENFFKYMREEFLLDALVDYQIEPEDPTRTIPNPERRALDKEIRAARADVA